MKAGDVTVTSNGAAGGANGVRMEANFNSTIDEDGNRVRKQGEINVETGDITAKAETGNAVSAYSYASGGVVNAETGSVTAEGDGGATGVNIQASDLIGRDIDDNMFRMDGEATTNVDGDITAASAHGTATAVMANVNNGAEAIVNVVGDVTATSADGEATGIGVIAYKGSETDVTVIGDVTAEGKEGTGISVQNQNGDVSVIVDGTVSGSTNSMEVVNSQTKEGGSTTNYSTENVNLTVWAAEENEDGHVAVAVDRNIVPGNEERPAPIITDTVNEEATKILEASINYIVKISTDFLQKVTAAGAKGNTVKVGETTYATANEGEDVNVGVTIDNEKEVLEGVYYNAEDESTLTATKDLKTDEKGGFLMKMLRGGAMLLGLKVHTHVYEYKYNKDATCTADGTETGWCACGKQGDTRTKAGTKLGHSFANYVSNGDATCTADGTKTGTCTRCGATDTVADEGSALGHSFGAYVSDGNATCTTAGTKTATCSRCGATDTVADAMAAHKPGAAVQENYVAAGPGYAGSYDLVVYCTVCEEEISRKQVVIPALPLDVEPPVEPAPATRKVLTYVAVDVEEEVLGVKASEQPVMEDALMIVAENLEQQDFTKISLPAMEEVLSEEQVKALESLPAQEQLILTLCALGYSENEDQLSENGSALLEEIKDQITIDELLGQFPVTNMTINGKECQTFQIEIVTVKDGVSTFQRFTFFNDEGTWKLYQVETGVYVDIAV